MGKIFTGEGWIIKVQGDDHPPIHAHVLHPDGKATIATDGTVKNSGVPTKIITAAIEWITKHPEIVESEWNKMNNPRKR